MYAIINAWVLLWALVVIVQTPLGQHKHGSHLPASQLNHCIMMIGLMVIMNPLKHAKQIMKTKIITNRYYNIDDCDI